MPDLFGWYDAGTVDPLASPFFFGTGIGGDDTSSQSAYRRGPLMDVLAGLPGSEQFFRASPGGDDTSAYGVNPEALAGFLQQNGLQLRNEVHGSGGRIWLQDAQGNTIGQPEEYDNTDTNFQTAALVAAAAVTAGVATGYLGGASGIGTLPGSVGSSLGQVAPLSPMGTASAAGLPEVAGLGGAAGASALPTGSVAGTGLQTINVTAPSLGSGVGTLPAGVGESLGTVASLPTNAQAGISAIPTGGNWWDTAIQSLSNGGARSIFDIASGLYGLNLASKAREASDPFAQYRAGYGQQLAALEANPSSITSRPGWRAGLEGVDRQMAARGYYGSGNMDVARTRYAGDFYTQEANRLAGLAGAGQSPGAGQYQSAQLAGQSLASIGYGLAPWLGGRPS